MRLVAVAEEIGPAAEQPSVSGLVVVWLATSVAVPLSIFVAQALTRDLVELIGRGELVLVAVTVCSSTLGALWVGRGEVGTTGRSIVFGLSITLMVISAFYYTDIQGNSRIQRAASGQAPESDPRDAVVLNSLWLLGLSTVVGAAAHAVLAGRRSAQSTPEEDTTNDEPSPAEVTTSVEPPAVTVVASSLDEAAEIVASLQDSPASSPTSPGSSPREPSADELPSKPTKERRVVSKRRNATATDSTSTRRRPSKRARTKSDDDTRSDGAGSADDESPTEGRPDAGRSNGKKRASVPD